jgi:hypothetical protein
VAIKQGHSWLTRPGEIRGDIMTYFRKHYEEVIWKRPCLYGFLFKHLSESQVLGLEGRFLEGEVAEVIEQVDGNKSPAPDEFNFAFFF